MNEEAPKEPEKKASAVSHVRGTDFTDRYANNVFMESSAWDLKIVFGSTDQSKGLNHVTQHTGISLAWPQVKLLIYFLRFQLIAHEARVGRIRMLPGIINPILATPPDDIKAFLGLKAGADDAEAYKKVLDLYEEFIAANPEVEIKEGNAPSSLTQ